MAEPSGTRLADVRLPRFWQSSVFVALLLVRRRDKRQLKDGERVGREIAESVIGRWKQNDERTDALITLNRTLIRLTWALLLLTTATLGATVWAILR